MKPIFREVRDGEEIQAIIMQFQVLRKKSKVSFSVKALKASQYKRAVEKIEGDVSLYSIPGIR